MTCYETICLIIQMLGLLVLAIMVYSIKSKEHTKEEEAKRVEDYYCAYNQCKTMEQVYKRETEECRRWLHFAFKYGCHSPDEMRFLIDDLIKKINKLETK